MPYSTALTIGDFQDSPTLHKAVHDQIASLIDQIGADTGSAAKGGYPSVEARLNNEVTWLRTSTTRPGHYEGRTVYETDTGQGIRSVAGVWTTIETPKVVVKHGNGRLGVNCQPGTALHVKFLNSVSEPAVAGYEVARLVRSEDATSSAGLSLISGGSGQCIVNMGSPGVLERGRIIYDQLDQIMRFVTNGRESLRVLPDGAVTIMRDVTNGGPTLGPNTVLRLARHFEAGAAASIEVMAGTSGVAEMCFGSNTDPRDGKWSYNNAFDVMEGHAGNSRTLQFTANYLHILAGAAPGPEVMLPGVSLLVSRNANPSDSCVVQVSAGSAGKSSLSLGIGAVNDRARFEWDNVNLMTTLYLDGVSVLRAIKGGVTRLTSSGAATDGIEITPGGLVQMIGVYNNSVAGTANVDITSGGTLRRVTSVRRDKRNVTPVPFDEARRICAGVVPVTYTPAPGRGHTGREYIGAIAEDVIDVDARLGVYVTDEDTGDDHWDDPANRQPEYLYYDRIGLLAAQVAGVHDTQIGDLATGWNVHQGALTALEARVASLEAAV